MLAPYLEEKTEVDIDLSQERVRGSRVQKYRAITLKQQALGEINGDTFQDSLPAMLEKYGLQLLAWDIECEDWLARAQWLGKQCDDFPALDKETLSDTLSDWFLPYAGNVKSLKALRSIELMPLLQANLDWNQQELLAREAPVNYQAPTGKSYAIVYDKDQGPTVSVVLQEMFGELSSPSLAFNRVPLRFELLSPARRPLQTTSDLAGFWQSSYFDIAKEMRGRYPKHRWPEEPLKELPGHSLKKRFENKQ
jgi:ATP-dependent helicase HrpB